jgi:hypothetical protein
MMPKMSAENNKTKADTSPPKTQGRGGLQAKHTVLILGALAIIAAATVVVLVLTRPADTGLPVIDESNLNAVLGELNQKVERGYFETHMNTEWRFPDGKSPSSDAIMGNAAANNFPFWFTVTLGDGREVYSSSLLPVGTSLKEIVLSEDLDAGTYPAVLNINMIDPDNDNERIETNAAFNLTLIVEN